jgi:hypothetical protein
VEPGDWEVRQTAAPRGSPNVFRTLAELEHHMPECPAEEVRLVPASHPPDPGRRAYDIVTSAWKGDHRRLHLHGHGAFRHTIRPRPDWWRQWIARLFSAHRARLHRGQHVPLLFIGEDIAKQPDRSSTVRAWRGCRWLWITEPVKERTSSFITPTGATAISAADLQRARNRRAGPDERNGTATTSFAIRDATTGCSLATSAACTLPHGVGRCGR